MKLRILLDTSFLLPIVGVRVREVERLLEDLWIRFRREEIEVYYTDLNLLEILWKLSRIHYEPTIVAKGLMSIEKNFIKVSLSSTSLIKALELRRRGFSDLIDLLLYTVAYENKLLFLTLDKALIEFLESAGEDTSIIMTTI
mgnify:CR=1 FL=1